jgi:hypothetical protein
MTQAEYISYLMSETNVEAAIAAGMDEASASDRCRQAFAPVFPAGAARVTFRAVLAVAQAAG